MTPEDTRTRFTVRVPQDLHERLDLLADVTERTINDLVNEALREYVVHNRALIGFPPIQEALDAFLERYAEEQKKYAKLERPPRPRRRRWKEEDNE